jgi:hypothetical protein
MNTVKQIIADGLHFNERRKNWCARITQWDGDHVSFGQEIYGKGKNEVVQTAIENAYALGKEQKITVWIDFEGTGNE